MRFCDDCGHRPAERDAAELPDIVTDFGALGRICADCYARLLRQARLLGVR